MNEGSALNVDEVIEDLTHVCELVDADQSLYDIQLAVQKAFRHNLTSDDFHRLTGDLSYVKAWDNDADDVEMNDDDVIDRGLHPLGMQMSALQRAFYIDAFKITKEEYESILEDSSGEREVILANLDIEKKMDGAVEASRNPDHPWHNEEEREKHRQEVVERSREQIRDLRDCLAHPEKIDERRNNALRRWVEDMRIYLQVLQERLATKGKISDVEKNLLEGRDIPVSLVDDEKRKEIEAHMEEVLRA